jgi:N-methylhydantoinase B/oxoprolinase/acetone carboxylase alpha subunit
MGVIGRRRPFVALWILLDDAVQQRMTNAITRLLNIIRIWGVQGGRNGAPNRMFVIPSQSKIVFADVHINQRM